MYGWRSRIGVIVPSTNTTMEPEFNRLAPEGVSIHAARMMIDEKMSEQKAQQLASMTNHSVWAAKELSTAKVNVIVYGCTSGSFLHFGLDKEIIEKIESETGIPTTSTSTAAVRALKRLGLRKIVLASPYSEDMNIKAKEFFEANVPGLQVINMKGLNLSGPIDKGFPYPSSAYRLSRETDRKEADGVFISCTNFRTIEIIDLLEKDLGKPVVTSNQASMWAALQDCSVRASISGYGTLLEKCI